MSQDDSGNRLYYIVFALSITLVIIATVLYANSQATSQQNTEQTTHP